jgi:hypothetical protein
MELNDLQAKTCYSWMYLCASNGLGQRLSGSLHPCPSSFGQSAAPKLLGYVRLTRDTPCSFYFLP